MVDGISFLTTSDRSVRTQNDRDASFGVTTADDAANLALNNPNTADRTNSAGAESSAKAATTTSTSKAALLSASTTSTLLDDQAQRSASADPNNSDKLSPPTRTREEITAAVKSFDDAQSRANNTPATQKQPYFSVGVSVHA